MAAPVEALRHELRVLLGKMEHKNDPVTLDKCLEILGVGEKKVEEPKIIASSSFEAKKKAEKK